MLWPWVGCGERERGQWGHTCSEFQGVAVSEAFCPYAACSPWALITSSQWSISLCYVPNTYPATLWMLPISCLSRTPDTPGSTWLIQQLFANLLLLNVSMTVGDIAALPLDAESWTSPLVPLAPHLLPLLVSFPLPASSLVSYWTPELWSQGLQAVLYIMLL